MAIDYQDVAQTWTTHSGMPLSSTVYQTVEMSAAWNLMEGWLHEQADAKAAELASVTQAFQHSGDYSHEGLVRQKALLDITQAELLLIQAVEKKLRAFHKDGDG